MLSAGGRLNVQIMSTVAHRANEAGGILIAKSGCLISGSLGRFSANLLHMLPISAQCDYNAIDRRGDRKPPYSP